MSPFVACPHNTYVKNVCEACSKKKQYILGAKELRRRRAARKRRNAKRVRRTVK